VREKERKEATETERQRKKERKKDIQEEELEFYDLSALYSLFKSLYSHI